MSRICWQDSDLRACLNSGRRRSDQNMGEDRVEPPPPPTGEGLLSKHGQHGRGKSGTAALHTTSPFPGRARKVSLGAGRAVPTAKRSDRERSGSRSSHLRLDGGIPRLQKPVVPAWPRMPGADLAMGRKNDGTCRRLRAGFLAPVVPSDLLAPPKHAKAVL
jgi:hypothetical protein